MRKLGFLKRMMSRDADSQSQSQSQSVVLALGSEVDSLCLVKECRELEERYETCFTKVRSWGNEEICL